MEMPKRIEMTLLSLGNVTRLLFFNSIYDCLEIKELQSKDLLKYFNCLVSDISTPVRPELKASKAQCHTP